MAINGGPPLMLLCLIGLINLPNEVQAAIALTAPGTVSLEENSAAGTEVKALATTGETGAVTFSIIETSAEFVIAATKVNVKTAAVLNFEGTTQYKITIQAVDSASPPTTSTGTLTINLTDEEEAPTFLSNTFAVQMYDGAVADTEVGTFTATDEDTGASGTIAGYTIRTGNTGSVFTNTDGKIKVATGKTLSASLVPAYILTLEANDGATPSLTGTTTIRIAVRPMCSGVDGVTSSLLALFGSAVMVTVTGYL